MSITDCSLVGGADRSHPLPSPPVASLRSMEPTVDDGDGAEGNGSKRKQEDDPDDATLESTENDDVDDSEANTSNRCTVLRFESINKKNRTSCIVPDTDEQLIASVLSTAMEVVDGADVCPPVSADCFTYCSIEPHIQLHTLTRLVSSLSRTTHRAKKKICLCICYRCRSGPSASITWFTAGSC